ncbi:Transcription factor atf21 [Cytospora mali]|uniref:Transcription factor atf21 n=1 Tax=Cytospora mali TaxID=578113 RepID=A0A194VBP3_CYTMA|nr:Transcription factor atf21 [Valsa mali var. pyri (nom. inval.)]
MSSLQIAAPMTNPPNNCASGPADGRFFSPYPNYFNFSHAETSQIEQGHPLDPKANGHVYTDNNLVDVGGQFVSQQAVKEMSDFVPLGTQVAWDQGATTSNAMDSSMGMTSPMSQCVPMPLVPGISSFGPILNTWPMPPMQRRRPSAGDPMPSEHQTTKKRKASTGGQKKNEEDNRLASTATNLPHTSFENNPVSSKDRTGMMSNSLDSQESGSSGINADFGNGNYSMNGDLHQTQPQSPPQGPSGGSRLATQRARNRVAANKFRKKSKAAVAELEAVERGLSAQHEQLLMMARDLREEVLGLKNELLLHGNCDCAMIHQYLSNTARSLSLSRGTPNHNTSLGDLPSMTASPDGSSSGR